jgi:hypothetical protein
MKRHGTIGPMSSATTPVPEAPLVPAQSAEDLPRGGARWPFWVLYALLAGLAGVAAYTPLRHKPEAWSLALTAAATVGYVMLTVEIMFLNRRQIAALLEQVRVQREELAQQGQAFEQTRQDAAAQIATAKEAGNAARQTYLENIRARLNESAPRVSIQCQPIVSCILTGADGAPLAAFPKDGFIENADLDNYWLTLSVGLVFNNYGSTAVVIREAKATFGGLSFGGNPMSGATLLLPPTAPQPKFAALSGKWELAGLQVGQARLIIGRSPTFGVGCTFEVSDMLGEVTDEHALDFNFAAISADGSRAKLAGAAVPIHSNNGGISRVTRKYNYLPDN